MQLKGAKYEGRHLHSMIEYTEGHALRMTATFGPLRLEHFIKSFQKFVFSAWQQKAIFRKRSKLLYFDTALRTHVP